MSECVAVEVDERRKQKLESARRKLKTFRASRPSSSRSSTASSSSPPGSRSPKQSRSPTIPIPLTTAVSENIACQTHSRKSSTGKLADTAMDASRVEEQEMLTGHRRTASRSSMSGHRRQRSSVSLDPPIRSNLMGPFDMPATTSLPSSRKSSPGLLIDSNAASGNWLTLPALPPSDIITTPATPLSETPPNDVFSDCSPSIVTPKQQDESTRERLSSFSFGSKAPSPSSPLRALRSNPSSPFTSRRSGALALSPSHSPTPSFSAPSNLNFLATPNSRPPSLYLIKPTPTPVAANASHPAGVGPSTAANSPSPPTPARNKRHSHTRSNSISLPNLKLGSRPTSLGIPLSPSFPSSPASPSVTSSTGELSPNRVDAAVGGSKKLKFEPSGRGAEAEKEKEESRRQALEKLTGKTAPQQSPIEEPTAEISLPDLDDEDACSVASSVTRPLSDAFTTFSFGRPPSLTLPSSTSSPTTGSFAWGEEATESSIDKWSLGLRSFEKDEGLGFALDPPSMMGKRASVTTGLSVLAEVDESEEEEQPSSSSPELSTANDTIPESESTAEQIEEVEEDISVGSAASAEKTTEPTPNRLRELHLVSSASISISGSPHAETSTPDALRSFTMSRVSTSSSGSVSQTPTRTFGAIGPVQGSVPGPGRARPRPLSGTFRYGAGGGSSTSPGTGIFNGTPKSGRSANALPRRKLGGSGSISYKKDIKVDHVSQNDRGSGGSSSSHWSLNMRSPPIGTANELATSPPMLNPPGFGGWGNFNRSHGNAGEQNSHLYGLGLGSTAPESHVSHHQASEGAEPPTSTSSSRWATEPLFSPPSFRIPSQTPPLPASLSSVPYGTGESVSLSWRDDRLELEMERDALREDVEMWRVRCECLEEKLESERKEVGVLRERVRKLGDRLSSISSSQPPDLVSPSANFATSNTFTSSSAQLITELRQQLFTLTSSLEKERRVNTSATGRITELEHEVAQVRFGAADVRAPLIRPQAVKAGFKPILPSQAFSTFQRDEEVAAPPPIWAKPGGWNGIYDGSDATADNGEGGDESYGSGVPAISTLPSANPEPYAPGPEPAPAIGNARPDMVRMKSWGFPTAANSKTSPPASVKATKRESFFALPEVLRQTPEAEGHGVDLPCFVMPDQGSAQSSAIKQSWYGLSGLSTTHDSPVRLSQSSSSPPDTRFDQEFAPESHQSQDLVRTDSSQSAESAPSAKSANSNSTSTSGSASGSITDSAVSALSYLSSWMSRSNHSSSTAQEDMDERNEQRENRLNSSVSSATSTSTSTSGSGSAPESACRSGNSTSGEQGQAGEYSNDGDQTPRAVFGFSRLTTLSGLAAGHNSRHNEQGENGMTGKGMTPTAGRAMDFRVGCRCCIGEVIEL